MDKNHIFIIVAILAAIGVRLYRKYGMKNKTGAAPKPTNTPFSNSSKKEEEYEPYSKK
jgi:Tfp pilus assembly major pilin PilA